MAEWTIEDVTAHSEGATSTGRRLPPVRVQDYFNTWPVIVRRKQKTFTVGRHVYRPFPPTPGVIDRMLETMHQVRWLEVEQHHLVWMRAKHYDWQDIMIRFACDCMTAWRCWQRTLEIVAKKLDSEDIHTPSRIVGQAG